MPDAIFDHPRLARIYDAFDGERDDLDAYLEIVEALGASSVVDVGCGTGVLALLLASRGIAVTGVDPAVASLDVAREKPGSEAVTWIHGDATVLPRLGADLAVMTGNVAQVFLTDPGPEPGRPLRVRDPSTGASGLGGLGGAGRARRTPGGRDRSGRAEPG